jgi:hypothetical protein
VASRAHVHHITSQPALEGRHRVRGTVRYYWNATAIVISLSPTSSPECELNADNMSFFQKQYNDQDHYAASVNTLIRSCLRIHVIHPANSKGVARYILNVIYTNGNRPLYVYRFLVFARLPAHSSTAPAYTTQLTSRPKLAVTANLLRHTHTRLPRSLRATPLPTDQESYRMTPTYDPMLPLQCRSHHKQLNYLKVMLMMFTIDHFLTVRRPAW